MTDTLQPSRVDTPDLLARLSTAVSFLAEIRDTSVGSERTRLASKIEGIQRCSRAIDHATSTGEVLTAQDVTDMVAALDPGTRAVTESLSTTELGISKGCALVLDYATDPR